MTYKFSGKWLVSQNQIQISKLRLEEKIKAFETQYVFGKFFDLNNFLSENGLYEKAETEQRCELLKQTLVLNFSILATLQPFKSYPYNDSIIFWLSISLKAQNLTILCLGIPSTLAWRTFSVFFFFGLLSYWVSKFR